jgi:DNA-binding IclR family transcriptional regulator
VEQARTSGLDRDLDILDLLAAEDTVRRGGLGVVAIAGRLGRQNSQVSRALQALREAGMVERDTRTATYRLGWRLYSYAARTAESRLVHLAGPAMRRLVVGLGETTHLCVLREFRVLTLWTEAPPHGFRSAGWEGVPVDVPHTSAGQVLVSDWESSVLAEWFPALGDTTARTLADIRRRGYAVVRHEFERGVVGCSAPVRDANGRVVAALNVSAPQDRLDRRLEEAGRLTTAAAAEVTRALQADGAT